MIRQGHWTDVTVLPSGDFLQITTDGPTVRGFALGIQLWQIDAPEDLLFCRCAMAGGKPVSIHQGQSGQAWLVSPDAVRSLGICFGVQPVAIDDTYAYVVRDSRTYDRIRLDNGEFESFPSGAPGSSQGISDVVAGAIWWADHVRSLPVGGITLTYPNTRGAVTVGQADPPQIAGWNGAALFTAFAGDGFEPHVAWHGHRYAIVARTPQGAAYVECPPWPAFVTSLPHPPIPSPDPEPIPMPTIPESEAARAKAEIAAHPLAPNQPDTPWVRARVSALGGRWGLNGKRGDPHNISHDIFAYRVDGGQPILVDVLIDGGGRNEPTWQELPYPEPAGAVWIAPDGLPDPGEPAPDPGTPIIDLGPVLAYIGELEERIERLEAPQRIALKTSDGHYVCAEQGGGGEVNATRERAGSWEVFTVERQ